MPSFAVGGDDQTKLEWGVMGAYSLIPETDRVAPSKPNQPLVLAASLELAGEAGLSGVGKDEDVVTLLPGINLWHPKRGWQMRLGVSFPVSDDQEENNTILLQFGNHLDWGSLL